VTSLTHLTRECLLDTLSARDMLQCLGYWPNIVDIMTAVYYVHHRHYAYYNHLFVQSLSLVHCYRNMWNLIFMRLHVSTGLGSCATDGDFPEASSSNGCPFPRYSLLGVAVAEVKKVCDFC
jgi:hypothetical protein